MGVASGKRLTLAADETVRKQVVAVRESLQTELGIAVRTADGHELIGCGGSRILDYSDDLGAAETYVEILGISYPLYGELFPQHVSAYESQLRNVPNKSITP